ncbi:zinc ABC transporter ATP-binding protein AztA [Nocardia vermiculata]|uniref:ATP-binding cassette domain-containing protein n=1 Tax=Nocardia vermiculata TaxID=257274 RepID=A0A846Y2M0_9NOCA|nr:zinc ABC transporter ATP-binding protein AztA [Nocardia vermiculata]NKY51518.1 ATP-binding cassette domain-containing protein [Nocardia vermiculata]
MITMFDVRVRYGAVHALRDINLELAPGTVTALVGHNGSGKSTLLHVLAGLTACTAGKVSGVPPTVAFVPQQTAVDPLVPLDVRTTVEMGLWPALGLWRRPAAAERARCRDALNQLGIAELAHRRLGDLSGGQRQRALLAQALIQRADLVLLDEPATGLDTTAREIIAGAVRAEARRGAIVVLATHDREQAADADAVRELRAGQLSVGA